MDARDLSCRKLVVSGVKLKKFKVRRKVIIHLVKRRKKKNWK